MATEKASLVSSIERVIKLVDEKHSRFIEYNRSALSRMTWFVAISGFALINTWQAASSLSGVPPSIIPQLMPWLVIPWLVTGSAAIVTHLMIDEAFSSHTLSMLMEKGRLTSLVNSLSSPKFKVDSSVYKRLSNILESKLDGEQVRQREKSVRLLNIAYSAERIALISLLASFGITAWIFLSMLGATPTG